MDCLFQALPFLHGLFGKFLVVPDAFQLLGVPYLVPIPFQGPINILPWNYFDYQHIFFVNDYLNTAIRGQWLNIGLFFRNMADSLANTTLDFDLSSLAFKM